MLFYIILNVLFVHAYGQQRIAGGESISIEKYPFATALLTNQGSGSSYTYGCGGAVVTNRAILSAASCFYTNAEVHPASWWRARTGSTYSSSGGVIYLINRITTHPDFSPATLVADIAVLRTTLQMVFNDGSLQPAPLRVLFTFVNNQALEAIGWGATSSTGTYPSEDLQEVTVYVINQQTCANRLSDTGATLTDNMVCVGWLDVGIVGQCHGDWGSPLLHNGSVVGVFSRSQECATDGWYPEVNTRLEPYFDWVVQAAYQS